MGKEGKMSGKCKVQYSRLESSILSQIPKDGSKISTLELVNRVYPSGKIPRSARQSIMDAANKLISKSDDNEEEWEIFKSKPRGSQPAYFWIEPRKPKEANNDFKK